MIYVFLAAAAVVLDQWFKVWIVEHITLGGSMRFLPGVLELTNVRNYGAAFSILEGMTGFFLVVTLLFCVAAIVVLVLRKIRSPLGNFALAMVLGGALGNALDRIVNPGGYVVDMFRTTFMNFAVFNIADCFIVVGGILFCVFILLSGREAGGQGRGRPGGKHSAGRKPAAQPLSEEPAAPLPETDELHIETEMQPTQLPEMEIKQEFSLDDILKEFGGGQRDDDNGSSRRNGDET